METWPSGFLAGSPAKSSDRHACGPSDVCPFPGLEAWGKRGKIFLRTAERDPSCGQLYGAGLDGVYRRWLQVEGTSGVGKSSLVRAGIIPTIKKGWAAPMKREHGEGGALSSRCGRAPMILNPSEALSKSLAKKAESFGDECHRILQSDDTALQVGLRGWVPAGEALVLVIDQLEEISRSRKTARFVNDLTPCWRTPYRTRMVPCMSSQPSGAIS